MKKTLKVFAAIVIGLTAIFALNLVGNVVFTYIALHGEASYNFSEELAPGSSLAEIFSHSVEEAANGIRETYREHDSNVPIGTVWEDSFLRTIRGMHITDYFEPNYVPYFESPDQGSWTDILDDISKDTWNTINSTMNQELMEGTKPQHIEVVDARNGSVLRLIEDVTEVTALMESMRTDDWELTPESTINLIPRYELVVYQQVKWPTGAKIQEIGRYIIYENGDYVGFHMTLMPIGISDFCLSVPGDVAEQLLKIY